MTNPSIASVTEAARDPGYRMVVAWPGGERSFTYDELLPYYEWVEETLPVQTAPMDTKATTEAPATSRTAPGVCVSDNVTPRAVAGDVGSNQDG